MLFDWIRRAVRNAVLAGINEAVAELTGARDSEAGPEVTLLLPGPEEAQEKQEPRMRRKG